jgi:hypothetical protein
MCPEIRARRFSNRSVVAPLSGGADARTRHELHITEQIMEFESCLMAFDRQTHDAAAKRVAPAGFLFDRLRNGTGPGPTGDLPG